MSEQIAQKFGSLVNKEMVKKLFLNIEGALEDNRSKAADKCDITTKSVYDWDVSQGEPKLETKQKILKTALEISPIQTTGYLTFQMHNYSSDILMSHLSTIYENVFTTKNNEEFLERTREFDNARKHFAGLIHDKLAFEVSDMTGQLSSYARSNNIAWDPENLQLYRYDEIKNAVSEIITSWIFPGMPQTAKELSERSKLPIETASWVQEIMKEKLDLGTPISDFEVGAYIMNNGNTMLTEPVPTQEVKQTKPPRRELRTL